MYPQQYKDFLEFLDNNPEYVHDLRVRLLSPELIALPEQFAQLVAAVNELAAKFEAFASETNRRMTALESDVGTLNDNVGILTDDVDTLKDDVDTLKKDVTTLKGSDLEQRARDNILNIANDEMDLARGRILLSRGRDTAQTLLKSITEAEDNGLITERQADNVLVSDIIIRARRTSDKEWVHAVFEVSRTIRQGDIQRASERAATMAAATGETALAAVVGERIRPQQAALAKESGVQVLIPAMLRQEDSGEEETDSC